MKLKEFLKCGKGDICLLWFENNNLSTLEVKGNKYNDIPKFLLDMEYIESEETDDCLEVWIR